MEKEEKQRNTLLKENWDSGLHNRTENLKSSIAHAALEMARLETPENIKRMYYHAGRLAQLYEDCEIFNRITGSE